jgi:hypothetical protein
MIYYSLERTQEGYETVMQWAVDLSMRYQARLAKFAEEHPEIPVIVGAAIITTIILVETFPAAAVLL